MRQGQYNGVVGGETLNVNSGKGSFLGHAGKVGHGLGQWESGLTMRG